MFKLDLVNMSIYIVVYLYYKNIQMVLVHYKKS
jgi:hypothetical protein